MDAEQLRCALLEHGFTEAAALVEANIEAQETEEADELDDDRVVYGNFRTPTRRLRWRDFNEKGPPKGGLSRRNAPARRQATAPEAGVRASRWNQRSLEEVITVCGSLGPGLRAASSFNVILLLPIHGGVAVLSRTTASRPVRTWPGASVRPKG
jgi:hypothetical protein